MKYRKIKIAGVFFACASCTNAYAGGPAAVAGTNGSTAVIYDNPSITMHIESGDIGPLSNAVAIPLAQEALDLWNDVSTSTVNLTLNQTQIDLDIDQSNYTDYIPDDPRTELNADDNLNPIVFDNDGKIIEDIFGLTQSSTILGFAESIIDVNSGRYLEGYIVLNGNTIDSSTEFKLTFAHETGHFIGLDHSQLNIDNKESFPDLPFFCLTTASKNYPLMYPVSCRDEESLHVDDASAVSSLYPSTDINDNFGILQGRFLDEAGSALPGANIWAENTSSGEVYSVVSDFLTQSTGFYKMHLPAGSYTLHANSINTEFTAGSGVGPYTTSNSDISFSAPHPIAEVTYFGSADVDDDILSITTGQTLTIDFSSIGARVIPVSSADENDSIADLFGAVSHITLLILSGLLLLGRRHLQP